MLGPDGASGLAVLELYAGTGAVGFELLEHGARQVDFVELDRRRADRIDQEIRRRRLEASATARRGEATKALHNLAGNQYDLVFADPPYDLDPWEELITGLQAHNLLKPRAWIIAEHATRNPPPDRISGAIAHTRRRYGDSSITIYRLAETEITPA